MVLAPIRRERDRGLAAVPISRTMPHVFEVADRRGPPKPARRTDRRHRRRAAARQRGRLQPPQLLAGTIGHDAGALGGALLPLHANFAPDHGLFIKEHA